MTKVRELTAEQINAALQALENEIKELRELIKQLTNTIEGNN